MRYQIVYKTEEYRDKVIENIKDIENVIRVEKRGSEFLVITVSDYFRFVKYNKINESERGQRFDHTILEKGCRELLTEYQFMLLRMQKVKGVMFGNGEYLK